MRMKGLVTMLAVFTGFLIAMAARASAQTIGCQAPVGGFAPTPSCASNCCLTLLGPNVFDVGAGICVDTEACEEPVRACSSGPTVFSTAPDTAFCGTFSDNCCVTIVPNLSGVCAPGACDGLPLPELPAGTCSVCVTFVTTHDLDGPGAAAPFTRSHESLIPNAPYSLDVDGPGAPVAGGLPIPGYEVKVTVEGLSAETPTIRIEKLATALPLLPLRIEIVNGEATKQTFGYDTLDSTAPLSFVAALDLTDQDANPDTSEVLLDLTIAGAGPSLTVVSEEFTGDPVGTRADRHVRRLRFSGEPGEGTVVPTAVGLVLTASDTAKNVELTHNLETTLDFELDEPGDGTDARGQVDRLPSTVQVSLADVDVNGDGKKDQAIGYEASAIVALLGVQIDSARTDGAGTVIGRTVTDGSVADLPMVANLTYASTATGTDITYEAEGRASRAEIASDDGTKQFLAALDNLPNQIEQLSYQSSANERDLTYRASDIVDHVHVETRDATSEFEADVDALPVEVNIAFQTPEDLVRLEYDGTTIVPLATIRTENVLEIPCTGGGGTICIPDLHRREIQVDAQGLSRHLEFDFNTADNIFSYITSDRIPEIRITGVDERPFFARAKNLDLLVQDLPPKMTGEIRSDGEAFIELTVLDDDQVGLIELAAFDPTKEALVGDLDGLLLEDVAARYNLFARVKGLHHVLYVEHGATSRDIEFDAAPPAGTDLHVFVEKDVNETLWTNTAGGGSDPIKRDGTSLASALLLDYPRHIEIALSPGGQTKHLSYSADSPAGDFTFEQRTDYRGAPVDVTYKLQYTADRVGTSFPVSDFTKATETLLFPMPQTFSVCQTTATGDPPRHQPGDTCSKPLNPDGTVNDIFPDGLFEDFDPDTEANAGSVRFDASPRTHFTFEDRSTKAVPITYIRRAAEVDDAGDDCETITFILEGLQLIPGCRYDDVKPGIESSAVDLDLGEWTLQGHLESSGWVGHNVASIFAGSAGNNQGYIAMDTGWDNAASFLRQDERCGSFNGVAFFGLLPPPIEVQTNGLVSKGGDVCTPSQDCTAVEDAFPEGFAGKIDAVSLEFGEPFAAQNRVFEFDPDELIFAKHRDGLAYCGPGTDLKIGSSGFTGDFCNCSLPSP